MSPRRLSDVIDDLRTIDPSLAARVEVAGDASGVVLTDVTHDSRTVATGSMFCAVPGHSVDGHDFVSTAVEQGATAVLVERVVALPPTAGPVVQLVVDDVRAAMGLVASAFWGDPGSRLRIVGVTGTNGKTSTAHLLDAVLAHAGLRSAVLGTLTQTRTTPEATDLQRRLAQLVADGATMLTMEVTSHALALDRVAGLHFEVAVFTNLTQDHLDFHGTMEAYFRAKARLFEAGRTDHGVVNLDDPYGRLLADAAVIPTVGYSLAQAQGLAFDADGSSFVWRGRDVSLMIGGTFSISNALAAATAASLLGIDDAVIAEGLGRARVPGRFEPVRAGQPFTVIVDYAHTPDGLERVLETARGIVAPGARLLTVFGCGGDRDRTKRAPMGRIATDRSDIAYLTSDNPRTEDPMSILDQVAAGAVRRDVLRIDIDRRAAISAAIAEARLGDVVVIAGKGHEPGQSIGDVVHPFDDRTVAAEAIAAAGWTP